jgi:hypothetical protein
MHTMPLRADGAGMKAEDCFITNVSVVRPRFLMRPLFNAGADCVVLEIDAEGPPGSGMSYRWYFQMTREELIELARSCGQVGHFFVG